jgi:hypothetical protein
MTEPVNPTLITELPPAPAPTDTPAVFSEKAFATVAAQVTMVPQINAENAKVYQNAVAANERAVAADASADAAAVEADLAMGYRNTANAAASTATTQAGIATGAASTATTQAGLASTARTGAETARSGSESARDDSVLAKNASEAARDAAEDFRDQAAVFASEQIKGSSTTSVTPGAGAKSFTIEANRSFVVGMYVVATSTSDPATSMSGYIQSYNSTTGAMVIGVDVFSGASAKADWVIGVAAPGAASGLTRQVVTANTTCVAGVAYIVAAAGITLTLPTSWTAGDKIGIIEAIGDGAQYTQAWGTTKLRGRTIGTQLLTAVFGSTGVLTYQDSTRGLV